METMRTRIINNINPKRGRPPQMDNRPNHLPIYPLLLSGNEIKNAEHFNNQFNSILKLIIKKNANVCI